MQHLNMQYSPTYISYTSLSYTICSVVKAGFGAVIAWELYLCLAAGTVNDEKIQKFYKYL